LFIFQKASPVCSDNNKKTPSLQGPSRSHGGKVDRWTSSRNQRFISLIGHPLPLSFQFFRRPACDKVQTGQLCSGSGRSFALSAHTTYPERANISSELFIAYGNANNIEICYDLINYG